MNFSLYINHRKSFFIELFLLQKMSFVIKYKRWLKNYFFISMVSNLSELKIASGEITVSLYGIFFS